MLPRPKQTPFLAHSFTHHKQTYTHTIMYTCIHTYIYNHVHTYTNTTQMLTYLHTHRHGCAASVMSVVVCDRVAEVRWDRIPAPWLWGPGGIRWGIRFHQGTYRTYIHTYVLALILSVINTLCASDEHIILSYVPKQHSDYNGFLPITVYFILFRRILSVK